MVHPSTCFKNVKLIMKAFPGVNLSNKRLKSNFEHNIALFSVYISYEIHVIYVYFDCFLNWSICEKQLHILTKNILYLILIDPVRE